MKQSDALSWLCANFDITNKNNEEKVWRVGKLQHLLVEGEDVDVVDVLNCPTGAVFQFTVKTIRKPFV